MFNFDINVGAYRKFIAALAAAVTVLVTVTADGGLNGNDVYAVAAAFLGALGVRQFANDELA